MAAEAGWTRFDSPAGFYSLRYPEKWQTQQEGNIVNLLPPWGSGGVTVSAFYRGGNKPVPLARMLEKTFQQATPASDQVEVAWQDFAGILQEFKTEEGEATLHWLAMVGESDRVFALVTAHDTADRMSTHKPTYLKIVKSVQLRTPD